jgi:hypothetical protein
VRAKDVYGRADLRETSGALLFGHVYFLLARVTSHAPVFAEYRDHAKDVYGSAYSTATSF